jgi:hypothetical protein
MTTFSSLMPSKASVMVRSAPAKPGRVSNHAQRRCNAILAQPPSSISRRLKQLDGDGASRSSKPERAVIARSSEGDEAIPSATYSA